MSRSVVIFDPVPNHFKLMCVLLVSRGYHVLTFPCEGMASAQLESLQPDLFIVGCLKGYIQNELDIIRKLRAQPATAAIPILICSTGIETLQTLVERLNLEGLVLLGKPFTATDFLAAVQQTLNVASLTSSVQTISSS